MKTTQLLKWMTVASVFVSAIGCGSSYRPLNHKGELSPLEVGIEDHMSKAEMAAKEAQIAMDEAAALIAEITDDNGNINIGLFKKPGANAVTTKGLLDPITNKLREVINKVYDKAIFVKKQFATARQALNDAMAKLDQSNPAQAAQVQLIMAQLAKIDQLEAQFSTAMHQLASKLDLAITGLDSIIKGATTFIPGWGSIIGIALDILVMNDVKALILELKAKLMAL